MATSKLLKILTLDGGGFRGLSSLIMLQTVFNMFKHELEPPQPDLKPCEFFDLIAGTSTGGIIALMLGRLRMSIEHCIQTYAKLGEEVFEEQRGFPHEELFDAERLKIAIQRVIETHTGDKNAPLLDSLAGKCCKVALFSLKHLNLTPSEPEILRSYYVKGIVPDDTSPWTIWEAARATSAAPTFFKPLERGKGYQAVRWYDAGMGYNNPAYIARSEAMRIWGKFGQMNWREEISLFLSLGTGVPTILRMEDGSIVAQLPAKFKKPYPLIKIMKRMMSDTQTVANNMNDEFCAITGPQTYFRFNVEQGLSSIQLFEYEKEQQIRADTKNYLDSRKAEVVRCASSMVNLCGPKLHLKRLPDANPVAGLQAGAALPSATPDQPAATDTYSGIRCANNGCAKPIKYQQTFYWCIFDNKCLCIRCYHAMSQPNSSAGAFHQLQLVETRPQEFGKCSGKHPFGGRMPNFQGVTCQICRQFKICKQCISEYRTRKPIGKHFCGQEHIGQPAFWIWHGNSRGLLEARIGLA